MYPAYISIIMSHDSGSEGTLEIRLTHANHIDWSFLVDGARVSSRPRSPHRSGTWQQCRNPDIKGNRLWVTWSWIQGSWWGKGPTKPLIHGWLERIDSHIGTETRSDLLWRQQCRILGNGRKPDRAIFREGKYEGRLAVNFVRRRES